MSDTKNHTQLSYQEAHELVKTAWSMPDWESLKNTATSAGTSVSNAAGSGWDSLKQMLAGDPLARKVPKEAPPPAPEPSAPAPSGSLADSKMLGYGGLGALGGGAVGVLSALGQPKRKKKMLQRGIVGALMGGAVGGVYGANQESPGGKAEYDTMKAQDDWNQKEEQHERSLGHKLDPKRLPNTKPMGPLTYPAIIAAGAHPWITNDNRYFGKDWKANWDPRRSPLNPFNSPNAPKSLSWLKGDARNELTGAEGAHKAGQGVFSKGQLHDVTAKGGAAFQQALSQTQAILKADMLQQMTNPTTAPELKLQLQRQMHDPAYLRSAAFKALDAGGDTVLAKVPSRTTIPKDIAATIGGIGPKSLSTDAGKPLWNYEPTNWDRTKHSVKNTSQMIALQVALQALTGAASNAEQQNQQRRQAEMSKFKDFSAWRDQQQQQALTGS